MYFMWQCWHPMKTCLTVIIYMFFRHRQGQQRVGNESDRLAVGPAKVRATGGTIATCEIRCGRRWRPGAAATRNVLGGRRPDRGHGGRGEVDGGRRGSDSDCRDHYRCRHRRRVDVAEARRRCRRVGARARGVLLRARLRVRANRHAAGRDVRVSLQAHQQVADAVQV